MRNTGSSGFGELFKNRKRATEVFNTGKWEHCAEREKHPQELPQPLSCWAQLGKAEGKGKRDLTQLDVMRADWTMTWILTGPFVSSQPHGPKL